MSGLRVVFGNRPQELLVALAGELAAFRAATDPFARPVLLFGNCTLREDALATLAAHNGIVANVATPTFDAFLEPLFPAFFPGEPRAARLDRLAFQAGLLAVLAEDGLPAPVTRYVAGSQGSGSARARIELAGRLAPLFDGYAQSRPDWILQPATLAALAAGDGASLAPAVANGPAPVEVGRPSFAPAVANGPAPVEVGRPSLAPQVANGPARWQVPLLARVLSRLPHHHSVAALAARLRSLPVGSDRDPGLAALPPALFFYAPGLVPDATRQLIAALGRHRPTVVFAFNPCRELWDDLKTARTSARSVTPEEVLFDDEGMPIFSGKTDEYGSSLFEEAGDPELLVRLGRPLREQVRLWNETVDSDFIDAFCEETAYPPTTLGRLQQRLAAREADVAETPDDSFVLLAAGSPAREAELAASWIAAQARDRQIPLDRLAIVVPSSGDGAEDVYLPALRSAFAELGLPLRGYGVHADAIAQRIAGAAALLAFPRQARTPAAVVALLREPALDFAFTAGEGGAGGAGGTTPEELAKILDDAGIALGHRPRDLAGTYLDPSLYTFEQGFDRIALSLFRPAGDVPLQGHRRPLRPIPAGALPALARISELLTEADRLAALEAPLATWADELSAWIRKYFFEKTEFDVRASSTVLAALATLRRLDLGTAPAPTYCYADALRLAEAALASIPTTTRAGAPGVLCGPLSAFRGLPLAAVAFVGFGEGIFPQRASEDPLDLRRGERRPGDILTDDRDRAAFLELFCAVETAIALSWPATDATSGDPLPPSPLLAPFERALLANANVQLPPSSPVPHRQGLPRREILEPAWQELQPEDLSPEAIRSADARALGEVLRSAEEDLPLALHHAPLLEPAREAAKKLLQLPTFPPLASSLATTAPVTPLAIADLVAYVRCPVQGAARARLRLRLEEVHDDGRDGDPLEFEAFRLDNLVVEALFAGPGDVDATTALFRARVEADRVASRLPSAPYASARIEEAAAALGPLVARFRGDGAPITFLELGASRGGRDGREARPAQPCGGRLLQGSLPPVIDGAIILPGKPRKDPDDIVKNLSAFRIAELVVARAILMTCFQEPITAVRVLALGDDLTAKGDTQTLPEWDFYEAELFLHDLIGHASAQIRPRFAPLEAFVNGARSVRAFEEYRETSGRFPPYSAKGPVPGWRDWPIPEDEDLARELDERLGIHAALIRDKEFPG